MMAEGTVAQMGALLDSFSADDEASSEGDVFLHLDRTPNAEGVFESAKPIEHETAALDAIRERHHWRNGGILIGILSE